MTSVFIFIGCVVGYVFVGAATYRIIMAVESYREYRDICKNIEDFRSYIYASYDMSPEQLLLAKYKDAAEVAKNTAKQSADIWACIAACLWVFGIPATIMYYAYLIVSSIVASRITVHPVDRHLAKMEKQVLKTAEQKRRLAELIEFAEKENWEVSALKSLL